MIAHRELRALVEAASEGDQRAWERLVAEFTPMIRGIARRHRLTPFDQDDVVQRTFLALVRHVGRLRCPLSVPGWIATTARRECLFVIRDRGREIPTADVIAPQAHESGHDERLLEAERREAVWSAATRMSARQRDLVTALAMEPPLSQRQISERLGMPMGSIGPTRQRTLERMRKDPHVSLLLDECVPAAHRPTRPLRQPIEVN
jgi:RNA polymerase sigma factor (sigma-70 family)